MPISHISLPTGKSHFEAMRAFYSTTLAPLGYEIYLDSPPQWFGMGVKGAGPDFWLHVGGGELSFDGNAENRTGKVHVAFTAPSASAVDAWYKVSVFVFLLSSSLSRLSRLSAVESGMTVPLIMLII
jgi:hypothetical protein